MEIEIEVPMCQNCTRTECIAHRCRVYAVLHYSLERIVISRQYFMVWREAKHYNHCIQASHGPLPLQLGGGLLRGAKMCLNFVLLILYNHKSKEPLK